MLALPEPDDLAAAHDKRATLAMAERLGVPVPRPAPWRRPMLRSPPRPTSASRSSSSPSLTGAPSPTARSARTRWATPPDATTSEHRLASSGGPVLLQRWLPGDGIGVELLTHGAGRSPPSSTAGCARCHSPAAPARCGSASISTPTCSTMPPRCCDALRWTGLAMVEFRRGADGVGHLMEINGRVWGSLPLAVRAGMDFPGRLADLLLAARQRTTAGRDRLPARRHGPQPASGPGLDRGGAARAPPAALAALARARAGIGALASLADPRIADDLLTRSDLGPGLAQIVTIAPDACDGSRSGWLTAAPGDRRPPRAGPSPDWRPVSSIARCPAVAAS